MAGFTVLASLAQIVLHGLSDMKTRLITIVMCVMVLLMNGPTPAFASSDWDREAVSVVVDVTVARPFTFALSVLGSAVFVVALPVTIPTGSVKKVAHTLVVPPAKDTFTRPVGDLDDFLDFEDTAKEQKT